MSSNENEFKILLGRIGNRGRRRSFIKEVLRAARKASHDGSMAGRRGDPRYGRSTFGRSRTALRSAAACRREAERRVVVKARVVRHRDRAFRSALAREVDTELL
jgi:hypothetical protein